MRGAFLTPGERDLADATARLAAVQRLLKQMQEMATAMNLDQIQTDKHLTYLDAKLWEFQKELDRLGLVTRTRIPEPSSSGPDSGRGDDGC